MTQIGTVVCLRGSAAEIKVMRQSACEGCKQKKFCTGGDCSHEKPVFITVENTLNASVGDSVELCSDNRFVLGTTFAIFILPVLIAFVAYGLLSQNGIAETVCLIAAAGAFVLPFVGILFFMNRYVKTHPCVVMRQILRCE